MDLFGVFLGIVFAYCVFRVVSELPDVGLAVMIVIIAVGILASCWRRNPQYGGEE